MNKPQNIVVHHSVTPRDLDMLKTERSIENNHGQRGFNRSTLGWHVGYHYIIYGNGQIKQYRTDLEQGAHCAEQSMNFKSLGVCLIGDFDNELPSDLQVNALANFLKQKVEQYSIPLININPHRHYAINAATGKPYKSCYGSKLADDWARRLLFNEMTEFIHFAGTQQYGLELSNDLLVSIIKFTSPQDAKEKLKEIVGALNPDGSVNFSKAKEVSGL